jgi:radical SAM protein (TIGR01212 family)
VPKGLSTLGAPSLGRAAFAFVHCRVAPGSDTLELPGNAVIEPPYNTYSRHLRERFGRTVYRVAVDAGFGCPNRSGGRAGSGCTYCSEDGARASYLGSAADGTDLPAQVQSALSFLRRRYAAEAFLLYFQAFSNTNADASTLKRIYDAGLACAPFLGLNVSTRPDCIDEEKADLLSSYGGRGLEVWVELGLQSAHDDTLRRIRRGHTVEGFLQAYRLLRERGINVAVHLIFGLPGEGRGRIMETVDAVARLRPQGVKIHNLHVPLGTALAEELLAGELTVPSPRRHMDWVIDALERLPPETVIMRLLCETPARRLASPRGFWTKQAFIDALQREMLSRGARQGRLFVPQA